MADVIAAAERFRRPVGFEVRLDAVAVRVELVFIRIEEVGVRKVVEGRGDVVQREGGECVVVV